MKTVCTDQQPASAEMKCHSNLPSIGSMHLNLIAEMKEKIEKLENDIRRYKALNENGSRMIQLFGGYNFDRDGLH